MRYFFDAFFWVLGRLLALFAVCGVFGGLFADIPGVSEDPTGQAVVGFIGRSFNWALTTFREYPLGVLIYFFIAVLVRVAVIYPHDEKLREEVRQSRSNKRIPKVTKRAKNSRRRKGKR